MGRNNHLLHMCNISKYRTLPYLKTAFFTNNCKLQTNKINIDVQNFNSHVLVSILCFDKTSHNHRQTIL